LVPFSSVTRQHMNITRIMNLISLLEVDEQDCWFQQDGAMAHSANSTLQCNRSSIFWLVYVN
jgi:hypothetical protein